MNSVNIIGNLTKDPDLKYTNSGTPVASFSIAVNEKYVSNGEKKEDVSFFECVAWKKTGEIIAQYLKKGQQIGITGKLKQRSWDDKDGVKHYKVEIIVENFSFCGSNNSKNEMQERPQSTNQEQVESNPFSDSDIPF